MKRKVVKRDFNINVLEILAPKTKIDILAWIYLYKMYGQNIFYILNMMAGLTIKVPSHRTIVEAFKTAKAKEKAKEYSEYLEINFDEDE